uniref:DUF202 domain-containing protein n=1 Tax=Hemiselmis tepida TaxID=464990 RepID=A0A7S0YMV3_9CRYP
MSLAWMLPSTLNRLPPPIVHKTEPKQFYASERTFLTWMNMSVTIGSIGSTMVAMTIKDQGHYSQGVTYLAAAFTLLAIIYILYAVQVHFWRRRMIRRKREGNYDDPYGPMALAVTLLMIYSTVFSMGVSRISSNKAALGLLGA